jgi:cytochrome oxidase Cu insertion factor (SCO1/SenC/PrrC family)
MVAAWFSYSGWHPHTLKNYGTLLKVTPLTSTTGALLDGQPYTLVALKHKWVMVYIGSSACDAHCSQQLYYMRQTRTAQGKEESRIERLWVVTDAGTPEAALLKVHPGLIVWRANDAAFVQQFPQEHAAARSIFLVDPIGNLMLRFPDNTDPKSMLKDLKLLLAASQVG